MKKEHLEANRHHWDSAVEAHRNSEFYDVEGWLAGRCSLKDIELALLPESLEGLRLLHLQCHFGQDTLSLARRGARVTGVDFSHPAIEAARDLAREAKLQAEFIESDVYGLADVLDEVGQFDIVFTSYGTIGWLPDLDSWAGIVNRYLAPGGSFVIAEFHPMVWMFNEARDGFEHSYFNRGPIIEENEGTYAGGSASTKEVGWNHSLGEVVGALTGQGLIVDALDEHDYSPCACFANTTEVAPGRYQFVGHEGIVPMVYALRAKKPAR